MFDWYLGYNDIKLYIQDVIKPQYKVLFIGIGSSSIPLELYNDHSMNCSDITCMDFSQNVIKFMNGCKGNRKSIQFICMNCLDMSLQEKSYDIIFDKATYDNMLCGETTN